MEEENGICISDIDDYDLDGKDIKPILMKSDLNSEMRKRSFELAFDAMNKYSVERDISEYIKEIFDKEYTPTWQCVVGIIFLIF